MRLDRLHVADAGDVGRRSVRGPDEAGAHRVGDGGEDDRHGRVALTTAWRRGRGHAEDQVEAVAGELLGDARPWSPCRPRRSAGRR